MATSSKGARRSLISRTLHQCKSRLSAGRASSPVAGCFSVYVGPERERIVVRVECANHPLFRRLLDDAEREYGYSAQGPLALPGCDVDAFLDVLRQMEEHDGADGGGEIPAAASSPICGLQSSSKGRAAGYRMLSPRSSPVVWSEEVIRQHALDQHAAAYDSNHD
ncbi:auxin-responsive protein SAUR50-like [Phragmites australis]|uniref:auxin-responsive protein SAUR50-like n=1 Tax=Phragmites australis TaxID=29695 RepID=UPI002D76B2FC|nr:auxin-responsive protein SAUR50-like [Phragmites australis]